MIPALDARGLLPPGKSDTDWAELALRFATSTLRLSRLKELHRFIDAELMALGAGLDFYVAGSYLSDKVSPGDIDCTIVIPTHEINARIPLINLFDDGRVPGLNKGRIWNEYGVEIFPTLVFPGYPDFLEFFQYVGEKTALAKNLQVKDKRGILRITSWTLGLIK